MVWKMVWKENSAVVDLLVAYPSDTCPLDQPEPVH